MPHMDAFVAPAAAVGGTAAFGAPASEVKEVDSYFPVVRVVSGMVSFLAVVAQVSAQSLPTLA